MSETVQKRRKWPWITLAVIILLLGGLRWALQSDMLLDYVKGIAENQASEQLHADIRIDRLRGDLLRDLNFTGISVTDDEGTILKLDSLYISYNIWSLLRSEFEVYNLHLQKADIHVRQQADSSWNVLNMLPESEIPEVDEQDTLDTENPFPFRIEQITLTDSRISVHSPYLLPDSLLVLDDIHIQSMFALGKTDMEAQLEQLSLKLLEGRMGEPFELTASALFKDEQITLNELVFTGGASLLRSGAFYDLDTEDFDVTSRFDPISAELLAAYIEDFPLRSDINLSLSAKGNLSDFELSLRLSTEGLEELTLAAAAGLNSPLVLHRAELDITGFDPMVLLGEEDLPTIQHMNARFDGSLNIQDHTTADGTAKLTITDVRYSPYHINNISLDSRITSQNLTGDLALHSGNQTLHSDFSLSNVFADAPGWELTFNAQSINPSYWADDESLAGNLNARGNLSGKGFELGPDPINYDVRITDISIFEQHAESVSLKGYIDETDLITDINAVLAQSELDADIAMKWALDRPEYTFSIDTRNFNLAELNGLDELPTNLTVQLYGDGKGFTPQELELNAFFRADSSVINQEIIHEFRSDITIRDTVITLSDAFINSPIAEGFADVRFHLLNMYHATNEIDYNLEIKDLDAFAPIAGLDTLRLPGSITGNIRPADEQSLIFNSNIDFRDVAVDTISISRIHGNLQAHISDIPEFSFDLEISEPGIPEFTARHLSFLLNGRYEEEALIADYDFSFEVREGSGINQQASIFARQDSIHLETSHLRIYDDVGFYEANEPFQFQFVNNLAKLSRMHLVSDNISTITLEFEQIGERGIRGKFNGTDANLSLIQQIAMEEPMFEGYLSGRFDFDISDDIFDTDVAIVLHQFVYNGMEIDSLTLDGNTRNEWLELDLNVKDEGQYLLSAHYLLPFVPVPREELDQAFFEREVFGEVHFRDTDLEYFKPLFEFLEMEEITGRVYGQSKLSGTAGSPDLTGHFAYYNGSLSGIAIDSLDLNFEYSHQEDMLHISGLINSLEQRVFDLTGEVPIYINFQTFDFKGPEDNDIIALDINSTDFRLATLNQFIPSDVARNLSGTLNTNLRLSGTKSDLVAEGHIRLRNGDVRIVETNTRIQNIQLNLELEPNMIYLREFTAQSNGSLSANGQIALDQFSPGDFDINLNARNFRLYDTRDIHLIISMNTRLDGSLEAPRLTGDFSIDRGTVYMDDFGERTVEEIRLDDETHRPTETIDLFNPLAMELKLTMERNFFLRNRRDPELYLDLRGELDILKRPGEDDLEVFGDLNVPSGYATTVFNKRFDLESGSILFSGPATNPELNIRTLYRPRQAGEDIRIYYVITGTAEEPEFAYESEPEMEFQDIISYTIFGRPAAALAGWERTVTGRSESSMVADLALDLLLDRIEQLAADRLGIDVIEIDNTQKSTGSGTSIKAGKYLTERLFVAYLQELGGTNAGRQVVIEYMILSNLDLIVTASDDYRSGVDLLWRYDY